MRYGKSNGWLDGQPAAVTRPAGKGRITYIGAYPDAQSMQEAVAWMLRVSGLKPLLPNVPPGVDVAVRSGTDKRIVILTNYNSEPVTVTLPSPMDDVLAGGHHTSILLPQYGVAVMRDRCRAAGAQMPYRSTHHSICPRMPDGNSGESR